MTKTRRSTGDNDIHRAVLDGHVSVELRDGREDGPLAPRLVVRKLTRKDNGTPLRAVV